MTLVLCKRLIVGGRLAEVNNRAYISKEAWIEPSIFRCLSGGLSEYQFVSRAGLAKINHQECETGGPYTQD